MAPVYKGGSLPERGSSLSGTIGKLGLSKTAHRKIEREEHDDIEDDLFIGTSAIMTAQFGADEEAKTAVPRRVVWGQAGDGRNDLCQLQGLIRSSLPAGKDEEKSLSFVVKIKLALKRRLCVRAQKKIKGIVSSALDLFDRNRGKIKTADAVPET